MVLHRHRKNRGVNIHFSGGPTYIQLCKSVDYCKYRQSTVLGGTPWTRHKTSGQRYRVYKRSKVIRCDTIVYRGCRVTEYCWLRIKSEDMYSRHRGRHRRSKNLGPQVPLP